MDDPCGHGAERFCNKDAGQAASRKDRPRGLGRGKGNLRVLPFRLKECGINHDVDRVR